MLDAKVSSPRAWASRCSCWITAGRTNGQVTSIRCAQQPAVHDSADARPAHPAARSDPAPQAPAVEPAVAAVDPETQNPKALALILGSQIRLHRLGLLVRTDQIDAVADRLVQLRSPSIDDWCWGYSFPWQTRTVLVPRAAPNLVCTVFVANALLDLYELRGDTANLEYARSAADYLLNELLWSTGETIHSFAYPLSTSRVPVHNANLLGAALLCRVARMTGKSGYMEPALRVARYSAARQRADGSWLYGEARTQQWVDNFHTGFNLSALASIGRDAATREFDHCLRTGFDFYRKHFIRPDGAPRYFHDKTYPIDVHCVAQSILSLVEFRHLHPDSLQQANAVLRWAMSRMWDRAGYFYYRCLPCLTNRIPYLRWSQAWMLSALVATLEAEVHDNATTGLLAESRMSGLARVGSSAPDGLRMSRPMLIGNQSVVVRGVSARIARLSAKYYEYVDAPILGHSRVDRCPARRAVNSSTIEHPASAM